MDFCFHLRICGSHLSFEHCQRLCSRKVPEKPPRKIPKLALNFSCSFFVPHIVSTIRNLFVLPSPGAGTLIRFADGCVRSTAFLTAHAAPAPRVYFGLLRGPLRPIWFSSARERRSPFSTPCAGAGGSPRRLGALLQSSGDGILEVFCFFFFFLSVRLITGPDLQSCLHQRWGCCNCVSWLDCIRNDVFLCNKTKVGFQHGQAVPALLLTKQQRLEIGGRK